MAQWAKALGAKRGDNLSLIQKPAWQKEKNQFLQAVR